MKNTLRGITADFRALWAKVNGPTWTPYRDPQTGSVWFAMYNSAGFPMASMVRYWYREPMDEMLMINGDFEAACLRGTVKKRIVHEMDFRAGLVDRHETL